ncbi:MAG: HEPN domain-containing protein [Beijerinckiaceae bacterium]
MEIALRDLKNARLLFKESPDDSAFFLQQSSEKLLRALLEFEGIAAGKTHDIDDLAALLPDGHRWKQPFKEISRVSSSATRYRYHTNAGNVMHVDPRELGEDFSDIETLARDVSAWLSFRLN